MGPYRDANEVIVFGALWLVVDNQRSSEVGSRRRSSEVIVEVRQLLEHKERTFELLLYDSETWTYVCKRRSQVGRGREKVPMHSAQAPTRTHAQ